MSKPSALMRAAAALRGAVETLVRAPRRKKLVAMRAEKLAPMIAPLLERGQDGVLPFPALRTQTMLRSGAVRTRRDKPVQGPR